MVREFVLKSNHRETAQIAGGAFEITREEFIDLNGSRILIRQRGVHIPYVEIAGYVKGSEYTKGGLRMVKCDPVPQNEREGLAGIVRAHRFEGDIYWV